MIKRTFQQTLNCLRPNLKNMFKTLVPSRGFSTAKVDGLKAILTNEINHEETNYSPVDQSEMKTFLSSTKFQFVDQPDSLVLELSKSQGNYDITINFHARPPNPQDDQVENEQEKSKNFK